MTNSVNNVVTDSITDDFMFVDAQSNVHLMAVENNVASPGSFVKSGHYTGFIWQVCVYAYCVADFAAVIGGPGEAGECVVCPSDNQNLIDCAWNEYRDPETGSCQSCKSTCPEGCQMAEHCNVCLDEQCGNCPAWSDCLDCIENADFNAQNDCECLPTFTYNRDENVCSGCHPWCSECFGASNL